jgi:hypothetical protein
VPGVLTKAASKMDFNHLVLNLNVSNSEVFLVFDETKLFPTTFRRLDHDLYDTMQRRQPRHHDKLPVQDLGGIVPSSFSSADRAIINTTKLPTGDARHLAVCVMAASVPSTHDGAGLMNLCHFGDWSGVRAFRCDRADGIHTLFLGNAANDVLLP